MEKKIDKRKFNRGHKGVSGRKPKSEEVALIEKLTPLAPLAYAKLEEGMNEGDFKFIQLFFHYFAGKPRETKDITVSKEVPMFNLDYDELSEDIDVLDGE